MAEFANSRKRKFGTAPYNFAYELLKSQTKSVGNFLFGAVAHSVLLIQNHLKNAKEEDVASVDNIMARLQRLPFDQLQVCHFFFLADIPLLTAFSWLTGKI